jgi:hypothetical protein
MPGSGRSRTIISGPILPGTIGTWAVLPGTGGARPIVPGLLVIPLNAIARLAARIAGASFGALPPTTRTGRSRCPTTRTRRSRRPGTGTGRSRCRSARPTKGAAIGGGARRTAGTVAVRRFHYQPPIALGCAPAQTANPATLLIVAPPIVPISARALPNTCAGRRKPRSAARSPPEQTAA